MSQRPEPNWQPISQLQLLTSMVYTVLEQVKGNTRLSCRSKTDRTSWMVISSITPSELYQAQIDDVWYYEEQFSRWLAEPLTDLQRREVYRLSAQLPRIKESSQEILDLIDDLMDEMKDGKIDRILEYSDLERELEFLLKNMKG